MTKKDMEGHEKLNEFISTASALLKFLEPSVLVKEKHDESNLILTITAENGGSLIGKNGLMIKSLRVVLIAIGKKIGFKKVMVEYVDK